MFWESMTVLLEWPGIMAIMNCGKESSGDSLHDSDVVNMVHTMKKDGYDWGRNNTGDPSELYSIGMYGPWNTIKM